MKLPNRTNRAAFRYGFETAYYNLLARLCETDDTAACAALSDTLTKLCSESES